MPERGQDSAAVDTFYGSDPSSTYAQLKGALYVHL